MLGIRNVTITNEELIKTNKKLNCIKKPREK